MKTLMKFFKILLITIATVVALALLTIFVGHKFIFKIPYSETPTVEDIRGDGLCLGVGCQPKIHSVTEFLPTFARQLSIYNQRAAQYWPDNKVREQYALVESIEHNKQWLVAPNGKTTSLKKADLKKLIPVRPRYDTGFSLFEGEGIRGVYLALSEKEITNYLSFQKYPHLGTYDLFITYSHELFHLLEQDSNWKTPEVIVNASRNDRFDDTPARAKRNLLYAQILEAVAAETPSDLDSLTLDMLATYKDYKDKYPDDYQAAQYLDRIEGTAYYFELVSCLYSGYDKEIKTPESLYNALRLLARNTDTFAEIGLGIEAYHIGGWSAVLSDCLNPEDQDGWKKELMANAEYTPLELIARTYADRQLPEPQPVTDDLQRKIEGKISSQQAESVAPAIFRFLYQLVF